MLNNLKYGFQWPSFLVLLVIEIDQNEISNERETLEINYKGM
jgi:hypothetical protein